MRKILFILVCALVTSGCQTMVQTTREKMFGVEKRQFLKESVESVSKDQKKAQAEFKDAMTTLKELYGYKGGNLEAVYNKLKAAYDRSNAQAEQVHKRIESMDSVAKSMFKEWEKEIKQYTNATFASNSRQQLTDTKSRYIKLQQAVKNSESAMRPVLTQLNDHVLYLKHNLNAQAIGSLKEEASGIQAQIDGLITNLNASISEAERFIQELNLGK